MRKSIDLSDPQLLEQFKAVGIQPEALLMLPDEVKAKLAEGGLSPIVQLHMEFPNGASVNAPVKLQVTQSENGAELQLYPVQRRLDNSIGVDDETLLSLLEGNTELHHDRFGNAMLVQFDPQTNTLLSQDKDKIDEMLSDVETVRDIQLGVEQKEAMRNGRPVTLDVGGEQVTVGLDLREPNCFKALNGDMKEWDRQRKIEYDLAHPEVMGYVQTDANRWEYMQVVKGGIDNPNLKEKPALSKSSGMRL